MGKDTKICAVVKANAYGHGLGVAKYMEAYVDYFAVALVEEGVELRICGIKKPILVLLPTDFDGIERGLIYSLIFTIDSFENLKAVNRFAKKSNKIFPVHLKFDTGMHRFGFSCDEVGNVCKTLKKCKNLQIDGCFSHFFNTDSIDVTDKQFEKFLSVREVLNEYYNGVIYHISASGGIITSRKYDLDMVRVGLLVYGYKPRECDDFKVKPVLKIRAKKICTKTLNEEDNFLYGDFSVTNKVKVDILRVGYADGLLRSYSGLYNNACMDVCGVESKNSFGYITVVDDYSAVAKEANTISYEMLSRATWRSHLKYKD